jgi:signal transduction histidine kinase
MVMASHELKTPLTVISATLQYLREIMEEDVNLPFLNQTVKQVDKLSALISNLLDVSKIQAGKLGLNRTVFDVTALIEEISSNLQQTTDNHHIVVNHPWEKLIVNADRERIEQVFTNIIGNAIKYTPQSGDIVINANRKGNDISIDILDTGIGIPDKDIDNIFQRFYRVRGSASSFPGSGAGLYISSEIIKSHGGEMWAESEIGKGSVFHFSISG